MKTKKKVNNKKFKSPRSQMELIHHFVHGRISGSTSGENKVSIRDDELYYNSLIIAKIYSRRKKIVIINTDFNVSGAWGNGLSSWAISRAFDETWTKVYIKNISNYNWSYGTRTRIILPNIKDSAKVKNQFYIKIIDNYVDDIITVRNKIEDVTKGRKKLFYHHATIKDLQDEYQKIKDVFNIPNKLLNITYKDKRVHITKYKGWTSYNDVEYIKEYKPKDYIINACITEEEQSIIDREHWIHNWMYGTIQGKWSKKDKIALYDDVDRRKAYESNINERKEAERLRELEKTRLRNIELAKKEQEKLNSWLNGETDHTYFRFINIHLRFKPNDDSLIQTTFNVEVPTTHAKLLYRRFKQCIEKDEEFISNGSTIKIGNYKVERISKHEDKWYLKAGCHTIYKDEIDKFIQRNKLDW